jgi:3'-phosphoadenosine 5'-phosphosulfate sulfotransferase (PAPS reductase)/FAD synthetase
MNPYLLDTPAVVSFSGGRTSGYMLWRILQAFGGKLPDDVKVIFCNTGKERPETLDFVERCSQEWGVDVTWLEYRYLSDGETKHTFTQVNYATASRNGEPFEQAILARNMLPNVMARFCTVELKIRTNKRFLRSLGWDAWDNAIGLRADEPHRVAKLRKDDKRENPVTPLARAGATLADVMGFWSEQPFDLQLEQYEGNCDYCFLKGAGKIRRIMKENRVSPSWWVRMEHTVPSTSGGFCTFRSDRAPYRIQLELAQRPSLFDEHEPDELSIACHCTD